MNYFECDTCSTGISGNLLSAGMLDRLDQHERENPGHRMREIDGPPDDPPAGLGGWRF